MGVTVIGGSYRETCREPSIDRLLGSGMRAAATLADLGHDTQLVTCIDDDTSDELLAVAHTLGIRVAAHTRAEPVTFAYDTPLHHPNTYGTSAASPLHAADSAVLGFGMVETQWSADASVLVIDPQHASVADLLQRCSAGRTAIVLNEHEARRITGEHDLTAAAQALLAAPANVVVVKQGAVGGLIASADGVEAFGAHATDLVEPLGSGDAFSAGFAHAWALNDADPATAARFGSKVAAAHSLAGSPQVTQSLHCLDDPLPYPTGQWPRVYLAGPFFDLAQRTLIHVVRHALLQIGVEVFSPLHDVGRGGDEVAVADLDGLAGCHSVLALLDGADPGTVFEVGWATREGIPVIGFADSVDDHGWTMIRGTGSRVVSDLASAVYSAAWAAMRRAAST